MKIIHSKQNDAIKKIVELHTSKGRQNYQEFIAEGVRTLERFAAAQVMPKELYMTEKAYNTCNLFPEIHPTIVSEPVMEKMSTLTTAPGVLAVFSYASMQMPLAQLTKDANCVVLADLQDPGNMGTLIRSAVAFGYTTIITIEGTDPLSAKVIQASAGTLAYVKIVSCSWQELVNHTNRPELCAMVVSDGSAVSEELKSKNIYLVIGNEAHGLPSSWIKNCEYSLTLPMNKAAESLNAAVAGSIALFLLQK